MSSPQRALKVLCDARVRFVLIGGLAATIRGSAAVTLDVDICYERSSANHQRVAKALAPFHPRLRDAPPNLPFQLDTAMLEHGMNFTLTTDLGDLDLFGEVPGIGNYDQVKRLSGFVRAFGGRIMVLSLEGLIRSKKASGRNKDLLIVPELEALKEILEAHPLQSAPARKKKGKPSSAP